MLRMRQTLLGVLAMVGLTAAVAAPALAQAPVPWEIGMQPGFSPVKDEIIGLHNLVLVIITLITLFVGALLVWVMYPLQRASAIRCRAGPATTRCSKSPGRVIPVLILVVIAIPSFRLVYYEDRTHDADLTDQGRPAISGTGNTPIPTTATSTSTATSCRMTS